MCFIRRNKIQHPNSPKHAHLCQIFVSVRMTQESLITSYFPLVAFKVSKRLHKFGDLVDDESAKYLLVINGQSTNTISLERTTRHHQNLFTSSFVSEVQIARRYQSNQYHLASSHMHALNAFCSLQLFVFLFLLLRLGRGMSLRSTENFSVQFCSEILGIFLGHDVVQFFHHLFLTFVNHIVLEQSEPPPQCYA